MSNAPDKRKALGKGLSALLPPRPVSGMPVAAVPAPSTEQEPALPTVLPLSAIQPNAAQPRTQFNPESLEELAQSIRANGIIQPLIVRKVEDNYELIAGERRWRAAKLAALDEVPVVVQDWAAEKVLEVALIENIQREDLNAIEAAQAFHRLASELGLTQEELARRTGKDRSTIANFLRLLRLPQAVQQLIVDGRLPMGQARAILSLGEPDKQVEIAEKAVAQGLSTRQVEALVRHLTNRSAARPPANPDPPRADPNVKAAVEELERVLGTRVRVIEENENRGRIEIQYYSQDDLNRIYSQIVG